MNVEASAALESSNPAVPAMADFETRLTTRTKVPAERLSEFLDWPETKLRREADVVARVLKRFAEAVVSSMENPASAGEFLRSLDLKAISRDHEWRTIFATLQESDGASEGYQRAALIKYLQYLSFRKRLLEYIRSRKLGLEETDAHTELTLFPRQDVRADAKAGGAFERMPLGESIDVELRDGQLVEMTLAGHLFRMIGARPPCLIDQHGVIYYLRQGRNMVGRHPESDISVDQNFSTISRAHMIIEWDGAHAISLTDLSSKGTFLRSTVIKASRVI